MALRQADDRLPSWQAMDSGRLLLLAAVGMMVVAAVAHTAAARLTDPQNAIAFGAVIAIGELLRLAQPGGREAAPIATAAALAYALLLRVGELPPGQPVPRVAALQVITVTAVGMTVGALPHIAAGRPAGLTGMATRLVAVACVAFVFRPIAGTDIISGRGHWWIAFLVMTVLVVVGWLVEALIGALIRADDLGARFSVALWDEMRTQLPLGAAVGVSAMMIAFAAEVMGLAELAVFLGPLLVTQVAFRRYAGIQATYLQTVRALARVTEVGGYVESGHSRRVSRLAVAVGRELGLAEPDLLHLEYAALMHDIGQLALTDPIPGGATVLVSREDQRRIAELGADVISKAGVLDRVAELVRCQSWPSRGDPEPPVGSRIIRAVNAFDDLVGGSTDRDRSAAALERLRLDTAVEYDPGVVEALTEVAGKRLASRLE
ncbi:MAG TPA: HD domain-containing phosphohydrolase [Streptosporangiaceae bacterium]|nr:HD domain-containing phosphohydrolase [Streptosporangiaceae bacterium]